MKIEKWERKDYKNKTIWKHGTSVTIVLSQLDPYMYQLALYDRAGREHFRVMDSSKIRLEKEAVKWQRDYNRFRDKKAKAIPVYVNGRME